MIGVLVTRGEWDTDGYRVGGGVGRGVDLHIHRDRMAVCRPRREALREIHAADTSVLDPQLPEG